MICPRCGRQLLDTATYCPECGAPTTMSANDIDSLDDISGLEFDLDELGSKTEFADAADALDLAELEDSGTIEELGSLRDLAANAADEEPEVLAEPIAEAPLEVAVQPLAYETEMYEPVLPSAAAYNDQPYIQNGAESAYDEEVYGQDAYGYAYPVIDTIVPSTYANVTPIAGGVPTEHYLSRRRRRRRKLISLIILLIFVAAGLGVAWYTWDQEMWGGKRVPALVGMTEEAARSALTVKNLTAQVDPIPADAGFGIVLGTEPAEGERCATDTPVVLQVSSQRTVPDIVGMTADEAREALTEEGATNIILTYANSSAEEGTVIAVNPAPTTAFVSTDPITITIAQPYTVPEVVGMSISDAQNAVASSGLKSQVEYYNSWATRDTVTYVSPEAGTRVSEGATVTLYAPIPYPATVYELGYYYRITSPQVSDYLNYLNYTLEQGGTYSTGEGYERWVGAAGDIISFTNEPESSAGPAGKQDVLADGAEWTAVRYQCAKGSTASKLEVSEDNARAIAKACGLGGDVVDSCTQATIITPYSINRDAYEFSCIQGEWGDYVWIVLISRAKSVKNTKTTPTTNTQSVVGPDGTITQTTTTTNVTTTTTTPADTESTVIVALMPKETTNVSGLASYGNSFCDYFAYANLYSSNR